MHDVIIEEPYEFVPPGKSEWLPSLIALFLNPYLKNKYGIHSVECREVQRIRDSVEAGHGVLMAPNHSRMCDPMVLGVLCKHMRRNMHAMASWHLFKQDWFSRFVTRSMGAFSVYREGLDRQAVNMAVDVLVEGKRPLIVFPEGAVSRHNDQLMPMMDGTSFIARTAAKRRDKNKSKGGVVVHPIAIRYFFRGDLEKTVTPVIEEIESHFSWYPQSGKTIIQRLRQIGQALLSLKEVEYVGAARSGEFEARVENLIEDVLTRLEKKWDLKVEEESVVARVKAVRSAILPDMIAKKVTPEERHERWKQLAACYYIQQISHYPPHYVRRSEPNIVEHILETVERFEEDFTDQARIHGPLHAVIQVGEAIPVSSKRARGAESDPVMDGIREQLQEMLGRLSDEAERYLPAK
ncbi:MAG: 1-acyl-sn-glycerol-3-phosphate acyltransferase [Planctomycetota bacterium]